MAQSPRAFTWCYRHISAGHLSHEAICVPRGPSRWSLKHYTPIPKTTSPRVGTKSHISVLLLFSHLHTFSSSSCTSTCTFQRTQTGLSAPWPPRGIWLWERNGPRTCTPGEGPNSSTPIDSCAMSTTTGTAVQCSAGREMTPSATSPVESAGRLCATPGGRGSTALNVSCRDFSRYRIKYLD